MAELTSGQQYSLGLLETIGRTVVGYKAIEEGIQLQEGFTPKVQTVSYNGQVQKVGFAGDIGMTAVIVVGAIVLILVLMKR